MSAVRGRLSGASRWLWIWSALGAAALWVGVILVTGRGAGGTLVAALQISSFLVLVGLGQMLVIASGNGNIDLSIPNVMTLSSLIAFSVAGSGHGSTLAGVLLGLGTGLAAASVNVIAIFLLGIPPIVATLSVGLLAESAVLEKATGFNQVAPPGLQNFVTEQVAGIPLFAIVVVVVTVIIGWVLHRSSFGRTVLAVGQSRPAADRAGLHGTAAMIGCYLLSGLLAAAAGIALAAFSGPSTSLGDPYLLTSVGVVVLGGSMISGGRANTTGIWTAALLLNLIVTFAYDVHFSVAVQDIFEGAIILGVLSFGGSAISG